MKKKIRIIQALTKVAFEPLLLTFVLEFALVFEGNILTVFQAVQNIIIVLIA